MASDRRRQRLKPDMSQLKNSNFLDFYPILTLKQSKKHFKHTFNTLSHRKTELLLGQSRFLGN